MIFFCCVVGFILIHTFCMLSLLDLVVVKIIKNALSFDKVRHE